MKRNFMFDTDYYVLHFVCRVWRCNKNGNTVTVRGSANEPGTELTLIITEADAKLERYADVLQMRCISGSAQAEMTADMSLLPMYPMPEPGKHCMFGFTTA